MAPAVAGEVDSGFGSHPRICSSNTSLFLTLLICCCLVVQLCLTLCDPHGL